MGFTKRRHDRKSLGGENWLHRLERGKYINTRRLLARKQQCMPRNHHSTHSATGRAAVKGPGCKDTTNLQKTTWPRKIASGSSFTGEGRSAARPSDAPTKRLRQARHAVASPGDTACCALLPGNSGVAVGLGSKTTRLDGLSCGRPSPGFGRLSGVGPKRCAVWRVHRGEFRGHSVLRAATKRQPNRRGTWVQDYISGEPSAAGVPRPQLW